MTVDILLKTKFVIPRVSELAINRNGVFKLLDKYSKKNIVVISAPSGFGKTIVLSQWTYKNKNKVAWYSIDQNDNNLRKFLVGIILSIRALTPNFGERAISLLNINGETNIEYIFTSIINEILEIKSQIILILDDYNIISEESIHTAFSFLLENLPDNLHIFITTKSSDIEKLPLLKFKMNNNYAEITEEELAFNLEEIYCFFKNSNLNLSNSELIFIKQKTEGWALSLQLLKIYFQDSKNKEYFVDKYTGGIEYLFDYLIKKVFNNFNDELRLNLSKISVLSSFNLELLDLLTNNNGKNTLDVICKNNLFIFCIDKEKKWYRFHNLFSEFLYGILEKNNNEIISSLHYQVSQWFKKNGFIEKSYQHISKTNKFLIINFFNSLEIDEFKNLVNTNDISNIFHIFEDEVILSNIKLLYFYLYFLQITLKINEAINILSKFDYLNITSKIEDSQFSFIERILNIKANILYHECKYDEVSFYLKESEKIGLKTKSNVLKETYYCFALLSIYNFELEKSLEYISKSLDLFKSTDNDFELLISCMMLKADLMVRLCKFNSAKKILLDAIEIINKNKIVKAFSYIALTTELLLVSYYLNDIESLYKYLNEIYFLLDKLDKSYINSSYTLLVLQTLIDIKDFDNSRKIINKLESWVSEYNLPIVIKSYLSFLKIQKYVFQNKLDKAKLILENEEIKDDKKNPAFCQLKNLSLVCLYRKDNKSNQALELINTYLNNNETKIEIVYKIKLLILKAILLQDTKNTNEALNALEESLFYSEEIDSIRPFIDFKDELALLMSLLMVKVKKEELNISKEYLKKILDTFNFKNISNDTKNKKFSLGEIEVLKLMEKGLSRVQISDTLCLSINTIKTRLKNIYSKLDAKNNTEAVFKARDFGIL